MNKDHFSSVDFYKLNKIAANAFEFHREHMSVIFILLVVFLFIGLFGSFGAKLRNEKRKLSELKSELIGIAVVVRSNQSN